MCDKIKESDIKYKESQELVQKDGCGKENAQLDECLKLNKKDWRMCSAETNHLKNCLTKVKNEFQRKDGIS